MSALFLLFLGVMVAVVQAAAVRLLSRRMAAAVALGLFLWLGYSGGLGYLGVIGNPDFRPPGPALLVVPVFLFVALFLARSDTAGRIATSITQHTEGEPMHQALSGARDPRDFLARWRRLERYMDSSPRVLTRQCGAHSLLIVRTSRDAAPPMAVGSVAVLGVWIGALRAIGTPGLQVEVAGNVLMPQTSLMMRDENFFSSEYEYGSSAQSAG